MKAKIGDLEEEIMELFSRRLRKDMTGVVQEVIWKSNCSVRFQDKLDKGMSLNQLTVVVVRS